MTVLIPAIVAPLVGLPTMFIVKDPKTPLPPMIRNSKEIKTLAV
jgi:hypothetical protein